MSELERVTGLLAMDTAWALLMLHDRKPLDAAFLKGLKRTIKYAARLQKKEDRGAKND
jgi:hypothetical protein